MGFTKLIADQENAYGCILFLHSSYTHWINPEYCSNFNGIILPLATNEGHSRASERWEYRRKNEPANLRMKAFFRNSETVF